MTLCTGKASNETLNSLLTRRSVKVKNMSAPAPSAEQLDQILTAATRVPDHGKLCPWYFIVLEDESRAQAGEVLRKAYAKENPNCREGKAADEAKRFTRAPMVIAVVSRARKGKAPLWEQILSAGAVCQNLILATDASGFAAQWLTEWYAYNDDVKAAFGLDERDNFAGFIYIGTATEVPEDRDRPDLAEIVTHWTTNVQINKGNIYNREKYDIPSLGIKLIKVK